MYTKNKIGLSLITSLVIVNTLQAKEIKNLNTLTVTANKIEENIQEVPLSISAFDEFSIEDKNSIDLEDISYFVPNFFLNNDNGFGTYSPSIRGVSSTATTTSTTVGLYIDGVSITNTAGFNSLLLDAQRVEILRGPQGTLYGKGAQAGVINVISQKPDNTQEGKVSVDFGEDSKKAISTTFKTPIIKDKLYLGLSGRFYEKDGVMKSHINGKSVDDRRNYFGKIYLRSTPNDNLELSLISSKYKEDSGALRRNSINASNPRILTSDANTKTKHSDDLHIFKVNYKTNNFNIESVSAYKKYTQKLTDGEQDYSPYKIYHTSMNVPYKTLSQELKLDGDINNLKWLFGLFTSKRKQSGGWISKSIIPAQNSVNNSDIKETNLGVFTHLDYKFNDNFNIISGIRYDRDKNEINDYSFRYEDSKKSNNISPKIAFKYKIDKNLMSYLTVAKGYKNGGYYMFAPANYSKYYDSETLWNYELGLKNTMLDGKMVLNAAIYYMDIKDMQVLNQINQTYSYMTNAASASSKGIELDLNYALNDNVTLFSALGFNETKFDNFSDFNGDYSGKYNPYAPKYNYSFGSTFRNENGVYASANIVGYGKMYLDKANKYERKPYHLVNAKVGYELSDMDVYLYGKNIFDKNHDLVGYYGHFVDVKPQREIGVKLTYRF